jgi:hypothetical protein
MPRHASHKDPYIDSRRDSRATQEIGRVSVELDGRHLTYVDAKHEKSANAGLSRYAVSVRW